MESTATADVSTAGNGVDLPNHGVGARFLRGVGAEGDGGADGVLGEARGRLQRRRRAAEGVGLGVGFRGTERERERATRQVRERERAARRRGVIHARGRPGRGAAAGEAGSSPAAFWPEEKKRGKEKIFPENPLSFWKFLQLSPFPLKPEKKTGI